MPQVPIQRHLLDNGLRVVLSRDPRAPLVAVNLWYDVGSKHEKPGKTGFAHLFEHMMFQGSANVAKGQHFSLVQAAGGTLNAIDLARPHELLRDAPRPRAGAGALARGRPDGVAAAGHDPGEARQPARRGQERAPLERRQPALRVVGREDAGTRLPRGAPVSPLDDRLDGGPLGRIARGRRRVLRHLLRAEQRGPDRRRRLRDRTRRSP